MVKSRLENVQFGFELLVHLYFAISSMYFPPIPAHKYAHLNSWFCCLLDFYPASPRPFPFSSLAIFFPWLNPYIAYLGGGYVLLLSVFAPHVNSCSAVSIFSFKSLHFLVSYFVFPPPGSKDERFSSFFS
jgi:hypothetical protein